MTEAFMWGVSAGILISTLAFIFLMLGVEL